MPETDETAGQPVDDETFPNFDDVDSTSILGNQDGLDFDESAVVDEEIGDE